MIVTVVSASDFRVVGVINETVIGCIELVLKRAKNWPRRDDIAVPSFIVLELSALLHTPHGPT